jgi:uncharacterized delta-60 repeat protein
MKPTRPFPCGPSYGWLLAVVFLSMAGPVFSQSLDFYYPGANDSVFTTVLQADGDSVVGGQFSMMQDMEVDFIARVDPYGNPDPVFNPGADGAVNCVVVQADGKAVVGGEFEHLGGAPRQCLGRLNLDGSIDTSFEADASPSGYVRCLAVQADGKILAGGEFTSLSGQSRDRLGRLNTDGSLDAGFNPGANATVYSLAVRTNGEILVGGSFAQLAGQACSFLGLLETNGVLDTSFLGSANGNVYSITLQADGKILVGGDFSMLSGLACTNLGRLNPNGSLDTNFVAEADGPVYSLAVQTDGEIVVGGDFDTLSGSACTNLCRLNPDGTLDDSFSAGTDLQVSSLAIQADGNILVGGDFSELAGSACPYLGRLVNTDAGTNLLTESESAITWLRGGTSPEVWLATFDFSTNNGLSWVSLGNGVRVAGGWQLAGASVPATATLRGRGFLTGGKGNGSAWFVETVVGPVYLADQPFSQVLPAGDSAVLSVYAEGTLPITYSWYNGSTLLSDNDNISGSQSAILNLSTVFGADAGNYWVVVSNSFGSVTSQVATLTVDDPIIVDSPASQSAVTGQAVTFDVTAIGTDPMTYQWRQGGTNLAGATSTSLTLHSLELSEAGNYDVIVSNKFGSVTSAVATLNLTVATFDPFDPGASGQVFALVPQSDGMILVGGAFTNLAGQAWNRLGRVYVDGSPDATFTGGASGSVYALALQPDGKIVAGGLFTNLAGRACNRLGRLNTNGSFDVTFLANASSTVYALALQSDGKIVVGGSFTNLASQPCTNLGRLNTNGTLDTTFKPNPNSTVYALALQTNGGIVVGGGFTTLAGQACSYLGRLTTNGVFDTTFSATANSLVVALAVQADGEILVGGNFTTLAGVSRTSIGRLTTNGAPDLSFNPGANVNSYVVALAVQTDGKILVGGNFDQLSGVACTNLGRLTTNGLIDTAYSDGTNGGYVYSLAVQTNGCLLVGGSFTNLAGYVRQDLGRLFNTTAAAQTLSCVTSNITWLRSGSEPEVWRTTFESSLDGLNWTSLGAGSRITGGWQLTGLSLPTNATIRARGYAAGGYHGGSGFFVESIAAVLPPAPASNPLSILVDDASFGFHSNLFGFNFSAASGQAVVILASTNLVNWVAIQTNLVATNGAIFFSDANSGKYPRRFYRAMLFNGVLPPPSFLAGTGNLGMSSGQFGFNLGGVVGQTFVIQASSNLVNWVPLTTNVLTASPLRVTDPGSTNFARRFYRALLP